MKNTKIIFGAALSALLSLSTLAACGNKNSGKDTYDKNGRLILNLKNVYYDAWKGEDTYTEYLNEKFNVKITPSNYDYNSWDDMVNNAMNTDRLTDTVHSNLKAYNFGRTYEKWAKQGLLKALPDNLSTKWPNISNLLDGLTSVNSLKVNDKLYGIPVLNDLSGKKFSNFTYVYRRDRVKDIDEKKQAEAQEKGTTYTPLLREGDVYTWEEFNAIVRALKENPDEDGLQREVLVDEQWGFPSVTNFFKDSPHCFTKDANGKAINAFTSEGYLAGLEVANQFVKKDYYSKDQSEYDEGQATKEYIGRRAAILYDNFNYANYSTLREQFKATNKTIDLDDATAIMKVKGPDGKYSLEGVENWFGITMFSHKISDTKMEKILDIYDYLLSEEGTRLAIYGKEGVDYDMVNGEVVLNEMTWEKGTLPGSADYGKYVKRTNGAKYLRYSVSLGSETKGIDPYTEMEDYNILNSWIDEMNQALANDQLRIFKEPEDIEWMSTKSKNDYTNDILRDANVLAKKYAFGKVTLDSYKNSLNNDAKWKKVLDEINEKLGK